jgi:prevent-host-death family protein
MLLAEKYNLRMANRARKKTGEELSKLLLRAASGERTVLRKGKKPVAAVVPIEDFEFLEDLEDRIDIEEARRALKEPGGKTWDELKAEFGL